MTTYGYVKDVIYSGDGTMMVKVRIPSIHGPNNKAEYNGKPVRNYTYDIDLPYYPANLLSSVPVYGDVVELRSTTDLSTALSVTAITGGSLNAQLVNKEW